MQGVEEFRTKKAVLSEKSVSDKIVEEACVL